MAISYDEYYRRGLSYLNKKRLIPSGKRSSSNAKFEDVENKIVGKYKGAYISFDMYFKMYKANPTGSDKQKYAERQMKTEIAEMKKAERELESFVRANKGKV